MCSWLSLVGVVKDDTDCVTLSGTKTADAMPEIHAIGSSRALYGPVVSVYRRGRRRPQTEAAFAKTSTTLLRIGRSTSCQLEDRSTNYLSKPTVELEYREGNLV